MLHYGATLQPQLPGVLGHSQLAYLLHNGGHLHPDLFLREAQEQADVGAHNPDPTQRDRTWLDEDCFNDLGPLRALLDPRPCSADARRFRLRNL